MKRPERWAAEPSELARYAPAVAKHRGERKPSLWRRVVARFTEYRKMYDQPD